MCRLNDAFGVDAEALADAARSYADAPDGYALRALSKAIEAPRQELFRRLNMAPGGTTAIVGMRQMILSNLAAHPELKEFERDLKHLLSSRSTAASYSSKRSTGARPPLSWKN